MGGSLGAWRLNAALCSFDSRCCEPAVRPCCVDGHLWTAAGAGEVVKWGVRPEDASSFFPLAVCRGHAAPVEIFISQQQGILSIDSRGTVCVWDLEEGRCIARHSLAAPPRSAYAQLAGGMLAIETQLQPRSGGPTAAGVLTVLGPSLQPATELVPSSVRALLHLHSQGKQLGAGSLLALSGTQSSGQSCLVGLTQQGLLLLWHLSAAEELSARAPASGSELGAAGCLQDACFSSSSEYLLAVTQQEWLLFHSEDWAAGGLLKSRSESWDLTGAAKCLQKNQGGEKVDGFKTLSVQQTASGHLDAAKHPSEEDRSSQQAESSGSEFVGGIFLDGWVCPQSERLGAGFGAIVWTRAGFGQLLWFGSGGSASRVASMQLPNHACTSSSVSCCGSSHIAVVSGNQEHRATCLVRILLPGNGKEEGFCEWNNWDRGPRDAQARATQAARSQDAGLLGVAGGDVFVSMAACGGSRAPHLLFTGHRSGRVQAEPIAAVAMLPNRRGKGLPSWRADGQRGSAITCLLEHSTQIFDSQLGTQEVCLLISGAADGSVQAVELCDGKPFALFKLHTAEVIALSAPPRTCPYPWSTYILSCGRDGMACLISLEHRQCLHLLRLQQPLERRPRFLWSAARGFIACFEGIEIPGLGVGALESSLHCPQALEKPRVDGAVAVLWDYQTGSQDRAVSGQAAVDLIQDLAEHQTSLERPASAAPPFCIQSRPSSDGLHILEVDVGMLLNLLPTSESRRGSRSSAEFETERHLSGLGPVSVISQLLLAISLLHVTGGDLTTDAQLLETLLAADLVSPHPASGDELGSCRSFRKGDVVEGHLSSLTILFSGNCSHSLLGGPNPQSLARRLMTIVSLAKRLQEQSSGLQHDGLAVCACNLAASLTTLYSVRLREAFPESPMPSLALLAAHCQDENRCVREAARLLLATVTDPVGLSLPSPLPYSAFAALVLRGSWTAAATPEDRAVWKPPHIVTAAAICLLHPASVPRELLAHALPGLVAIACAAGNHSVLAARFLGEGLRTPRLTHWRSLLGDVKLLTDRLLEACETASRTPNATPKQPPPAAASLSGGTATQQQTSGSNTSPQSQPGRRSRSASLRNGAAMTEIGTAAVEPEWVEVSSRSSLPIRDALLDVLVAVAETDLTTFLHMLGHRLAAGALGNAHLILLMTLARVLHHSEGGRALIACHLPLLTAVVLKGLDPQNLAVRRACRQGVAALVKELTMALPMADLHEKSLLLAVGAPLPSGEPISVHDLATGRKKRAIQFRPESSADGGFPTETVSALCFSPWGDSLAAWTAAEATLRVWHLVAKWTSRLQRSPAVLVPSKVFKLQVVHRGQKPAAAGGVDFDWKLDWSADGSIQVLYGRDCVATVSLSNA